MRVVEDIIMINAIVLVGLNKDISKIKSLEKNPAKKGLPQRARFEISIEANVNGEEKIRFPMARRS